MASLGATIGRRPVGLAAFTVPHCAAGVFTEGT